MSIKLKIGKLRPECTWGDGPDVLLINEGQYYMLYDDPDKERTVHGISYQGSFCLNKEEARRLAYDLLRCVSKVGEMEQQAKDYFENESNNFIEKLGDI